MAQFHRSVKSSDKLKEVQDQLQLPQHKLIQDVPTRKGHEQFNCNSHNSLASCRSKGLMPSS